MTKRLFVKVAALLDSVRDDEACDPATVNKVALDMADLFESENPNFDRERFLTACGF